MLLGERADLFNQAGLPFDVAQVPERQIHRVDDICRLATRATLEQHLPVGGCDPQARMRVIVRRADGNEAIVLSHDSREAI